jgi:hypothetical protein
MSNTRNSFSSLITQFLRLQKNSLEIINSLNEFATSPSDSVEIEFLKDDSTSENIQIPSYGFLKTEINRLDQNILSLSGLENNTANIRKPDGSIAKIYQASILKDPDSPSSLQVPDTFQAKNNWFFESFLNPLLYISFDVQNQIPPDSNKVVTKRIIANTQTDEEKEYFDENLKGRNDITDQDFQDALDSRGIQYFVDEQTVDLPLQSIRYKGSFGVLRIFDETQEVTENEITTTNTIRKYKLNTLKYTDNLTEDRNSRTLAVKDQLVTAGGTKYEITSIDLNDQTAVLRRLFGFEPIPVGDSALFIYSNTLSPLSVDVNVGFDERQGIFIKSIDERFNIAASTFSPGICFWSNELQINTSDGVRTLEEFYNTEVSDFSQIFIASAKEQTVPAVYGQDPNIPVLAVDNFQVVQINTQITESKENKTFKEKVQSKVSVQNEISSIDRAIDQSRKQLSEITTISVGKAPNAELKKINDKIQTLAKDKLNKTELLQSTIIDLNNLSETTPSLTESPKYRVRGFWPIPEPIFDPKTGEQNIVQFNVRYRYLSLAGNSTGSEEISYVDNDGVKKTGQFTDWTQFRTDLRKKVYDSNTGLYNWVIEDVSDADTVNINQLDIAISKGERVEIQVQSISEAGWPTNPLISDWTESVTVEFPPDLSVQIDNAPLIARNISDSTFVRISSDLQAKGLDQHLSDSFTSGDKFYAHTSNSISSGFFDASGQAIDLFQKITQIDNELRSLRALIEKAKGVLAVYVRDGNNAIKINPGSTINLFGGYYDQIIDLSNPSNRGKIATVTYFLELRNEAATPLELASLIPGGQSVKAPLTIVGDQDYNNNRRYGEVPIQITSATASSVDVTTSGYYLQRAGFQSSNTNSQFVYPRYKSVGLEEDLYLERDSTLAWNINDGVNIGGTDYPITPQGNLIPFKPDTTTVTGAGSNASIWGGTYTASSPNGNGLLNEFCVHISHPDINDGAANTFTSLIRPSVTTPAGPMNYPSFRHALGYDVDVNSSPIGTATIDTLNTQQLKYDTSFSNTFYGTDDGAYPTKLGFVDSDEYLCGKYSCGSYLFFGPTNHSSVQVEGSTKLAKKTLEFGEEKSITVPIFFQMRAQDKLGFIGGWRSSGTIKNITYRKKLGIDIQVKNEDLFSFDLVISGSYTKTSLVAPSYSESVVTS